MKTTVGSIAGLLALALFGAATRAQEVSNPVQTKDKTEASTTTPVQAPAIAGVSGVRIVRLSQVKGDVQLNRKTDQGFETAFANLPIVQNLRLQTHQGVAEIEFEDNTTLRVTTDTLIEFPTLQRTATGSTITNVKLLSGTLYASLSGTKGNEFTVTVGNDKINLTPSSHIRIDVGTPTSKISVFNGTVDLTGASGTTTIGKKKVFAFDATTEAPPAVAKNEEPGPFDDWDKTSAEYHNLKSMPAAYAGGGGGSYLYGINDLNYYGSFTNMGGCGSMWRPYLASAAWDPFANGVWAFYPGAGYSWVSPYPWGWTPFHSGSWSYCGGSGWGWRPGGEWNGLQNQGILQNQALALNGNRPVRCENCIRPPAAAPVAGRSSFVVVNTKPLAVSKLNESSDSFVFRKDSAGLGVPRESLGKLNRISAGVEQHGTVSKSVYVSNPAESNVHTNNPSVASRNNAEGLNRSNNAAAHSQISRSSNASGSPAMSRASSPGPSSSGGWSGASRPSSGPSSMPSAPAAAPSAPAHH